MAPGSQGHLSNQEANPVPTLKGSIYASVRPTGSTDCIIVLPEESFASFTLLKTDHVYEARNLKTLFDCLIKCYSLAWTLFLRNFCHPSFIASFIQSFIHSFNHSFIRLFDQCFCLRGCKSLVR